MTTLQSNEDPAASSFGSTPDAAAGLGQLLRDARERKRLTLEQISRETRLPLRHLEAMERDDLASLPNGLYRRAEVRTFAKVVGLDETLALSWLERASVPQAPVKTQAPLPASATGASPFRAGPLMSAAGVLALAIVFLWWAFRGVSGTPSPRGNTGPAAVEASERIPPRAAVLDPAPAQGTEVSRVANEAPAPLPIAAVTATPAATSGSTPPALPVSTPPSAKVDAVAAASARQDEATSERPARPAARAAGPQLVITSQPPGARVTINGIGWGATPLSIAGLPDGDKRIRVSLDGYAAAERVVTVSEGRQRKIAITLRRPGSPAPRSPSRTR